MGLQSLFRFEVFGLVLFFVCKDFFIEAKYFFLNICFILVLVGVYMHIYVLSAGFGGVVCVYVSIYTESE